MTSILDLIYHLRHFGEMFSLSLSLQVERPKREPTLVGPLEKTSLSPTHRVIVIPPTKVPSLFFTYMGQWRQKYSFKYNQRDATLYNILYYCQRSTCFGQFLRPSSGAQELYIQHLVRARLAAATASSSTYQMLCIQFLSS
jgi:hypothetical protein